MVNYNPRQRDELLQDRTSVSTGAEFSAQSGNDAVVRRGRRIILDVSLLVPDFASRNFDTNYAG